MTNYREDLLFPLDRRTLIKMREYSRDEHFLWLLNETCIRDNAANRCNWHEALAYQGFGD